MPDSPTLFLLAIVAALGLCRATQIALHDRILQAPREWLTRRVNPRRLKPGHPDLGYVGYLIQCPWCLSIWIALAAVAGLSWNLPWLSVPWLTVRVLAALGLSLLAVVLDRLVDLYASDEAAAAREARAAEQEEAAPAAVVAALTGDESSVGPS